MCVEIRSYGDVCLFSNLVPHLPVLLKVIWRFGCCYYSVPFRLCDIQFFIFHPQAIRVFNLKEQFFFSVRNFYSLYVIGDFHQCRAPLTSILSHWPHTASGRKHPRRQPQHPLKQFCFEKSKNDLCFRLGGLMRNRSWKTMPEILTKYTLILSHVETWILKHLNANVRGLLVWLFSSPHFPRRSLLISSPEVANRILFLVSDLFYLHVVNGNLNIVSVGSSGTPAHLGPNVLGAIVTKHKITLSQGKLWTQSVVGVL